MRLIIPQSRIVKGSVDSTGIGRDEAEKGLCPEGIAPDSEKGLDPDSEKGFCPDSEKGLDPDSEKGFCPDSEEGFCSSLTEKTQYARFLMPISKLTIVFVVISVFNRGTLSLYCCHIIFIFRDKPW
jgi:hypothetical protein